MNTFFFFRKEDPGKDLAHLLKVHEALQPRLPELNITDGAEFLDDAIRMQDQPYEETAVTENEKVFTIAINKQHF